MLEPKAKASQLREDKPAPVSLLHPRDPHLHARLGSAHGPVYFPQLRRTGQPHRAGAGRMLLDNEACPVHMCGCWQWWWGAASIDR